MVNVLTWEKIQEMYPNQWVALENVRYVKNDGCNIETAQVICAMSDDEYAKTRAAFMKNGKHYVYSRTSLEKMPFCGVMV